jgi:SnoaL-like domain
MSTSGEELARRAGRAFQDRRLDEFLELMDPAVELTPLLGSELAGTVYRGHEGVRHWWDHCFSVFGDCEISIDEVREIGDHLLAATRFKGTRSEGWLQPELVLWTLSEVHGGRILRWQTFHTEAEALEAASLGSET